MADARADLLFECDASSSPWNVVWCELDERLNASYRVALQLATDDVDAAPVQMLGRSASLTVTRGDVMRHVSGVVSEIEEGARDLERVRANVVLVPAMQALEYRINTRIFQDASVPEILEAVLTEGLGPYDRRIELRLDRTYPTCELRVQYDESDLAFCRRLMEEEGIAYWFEHEETHETLVLADAEQAFSEIHGAHGEPIVPYTTRLEGGVEGTAIATRFEMASRLRPTKVAMRHFDWTAPAVFIEADSDSSDPGPAHGAPSGAHLGPTREAYHHDSVTITHYDYDSGAYQEDDAIPQARLRREAQVWEGRVAHSASTVLALAPAGVFELVGHPRADLDGRYVVLGVTHRFDDDDARTYRNELQCIPEGVPYRPLRVTAKPRIPSVQTAIVVGPAGEEIHTDEHGRIKVQFHWDRLGASDERSSAWIRVTQRWAGAGWGFLFIPRIGMEVVVDFLNGDPDRPVALGALYNGDHRPPYPLPDEKTKSTIKTQSSLGGGGFNELRFEDRAGSEEIYTHAQKDQNEVVRNDHATTVHHDQRIRVDNDQTQEIGNDQTEHVFANQLLEVDADRTVRVHGNVDEAIDGTETRQVTGDVSETFSANETRSIAGDVSETIGGSRTQHIGGGSTESIGGSLTQTIAGGVTITTPKTYDINATAGFNVVTPATSTIKAEGGYRVVATTTTLHDLELERIGQVLKDLYSDHVSMCVFKVELVLGLAAVTYGAFAFEFRGFHAEIFPTLNKTFVFKMETRAVEAATDGQETTSQAVSVGPPD